MTNDTMIARFGRLGLHEYQRLLRFADVRVEHVADP